MGIRLKLAKEPGWVDLGDEAALLCRPPTTILVATARHRATEMIVELREVNEVVTRHGGVIQGLPDLSDEEHEQSAWEAMFIIALSELAAMDWKNILDAGGKPLAFDAAQLGTLLEDDKRAQRFRRNYLDPLRAVEAEGNA